MIENVLVYNTTCIDCDQIARITMIGSGSRMRNALATPTVRCVVYRLHTLKATHVSEYVDSRPSASTH